MARGINLEMIGQAIKTMTEYVEADYNSTKLVKDQHELVGIFQEREEMLKAFKPIYGHVYKVMLLYKMGHKLGSMLPFVTIPPATIAEIIKLILDE